MARINYQLIKRQKLDNVKSIRAALRRKNSLAVSALVELTGRNVAEKAACELLGINYKLFRYVLDQDCRLSTNIKQLLGKARAYSAISRHENVVRKTTKKAMSKREKL